MLIYFVQHPREVSRKSSGGNSFAEKLDSVMVVMFEHLESCKAGGRLTEVSFNYFCPSHVWSAHIFVTSTQILLLCN